MHATSPKKRGRPTVATTENITRAKQYADGAWESMTFGPKSNKWRDVMPTIEGLAKYLGINPDTLYTRPEFSEVLGQIKNEQARILVNGGILGHLNSTMTKMVLSSKHSYIEKSAQETDLISTDGSMSPKSADMSVVDEFIEYMKEKTAKMARSDGR